MKDSVFKIVVLALLVVVFAAVVITAKWAGQPDYDHISCPTKDLGEASLNAPSARHQADDLDFGTDTGNVEPEATSAVSWSDLNGYGRDSVQQQVGSAGQVAEHPGEKPNDGAEPPDNSKRTYGNDNVE